MRKIIFAYIFLTILLYSCTNNNTDVTDNSPTIIVEKTPVEIIIAREEKFQKEFYSNGTIKSEETVELKFRTSGQIAQFNISEGQFVKKGQILAVLDLSDKQTEYEKAKINLLNAKNNYEAILLGQGYEINDSINIPSEVIEKAKIKSTFSIEQLNLRKAEKELNSSYLRAPFSGLVANIKKEKHSYINPTDIICTIINHTHYKVTFTIFETDYKQVSLNKEVEIINMGKDTLKAKITQINPVVNKGLFNVTAQLSNSKATVMDGMTVKIVLKNTIGNKIVVPRSAVISRQDRDVAFTVRNGKAFWNYVTIGAENKNQIVIEKGLNIGDSVIISNNISISHDTEIIAQSPVIKK